MIDYDLLNGLTLRLSKKTVKNPETKKKMQFWDFAYRSIIYEKKLFLSAKLIGRKNRNKLAAKTKKEQEDIVSLVLLSLIFHKIPYQEFEYLRTHKIINFEVV